MVESNNLEKYNKTVKNRSPQHKKRKIEHPKGFEPSVTYKTSTKTGEIVSSPQKNNKIDWKEQLESYFGKDIHKYKVLEDTERFFLGF